MRKYFLFFLLLVNTSLFSQYQKKENKIDTLSFLLKEYRNSKNSELPSKAFLLAEKTNVDTIVKKTYIDFGLRSYFLEDLPNLSLSEKKLLKLFKKTKDSFALAKHYHYKALIFKIKVISDSCFYYYNKSKDLSMQLNDSLEVARRYLSMSDIQNNERDYLGSENSVINGLRFIEPLNEVRFTSTFYENLGRVLRITGRSKEARKYYLKYLDTHINSSKKNIDVKYSIFYSQTAKSYEAEFNYLKARDFYKKSIEVDSIAIKNLYRYIVGLEGYSYNNFMLGNKKLALKGYLEVLALRKKENRKKELVYSHSLLGEFYATDKQTKKAVFHTKKALELSKKYNNSERILENLFLLSKLVKGEKGRQYLQEHFILNDSLFKRERSLKNQFAKVRYETEKKDKENANLKEENSRKQLEIESEEQQKIISWLISGASILFIAIGLLVVYNRRKKLLFEAKLEQIEAREKERQQIAKSLHDEVAGDIRVLYKKLTQNNLVEESKELDRVKENVRTLSHQLSSVSFDEVSFKNQIINLISDYFDASFLIKVKDINDVNWIDINNSIKRTLFLSVRESIQNIDKYAAAKNVTLIFNETKKIISLSIIDDGKGFNVDKKKNGIGLKNMKERVEEISGTFSILSALNKGTTIDIEIPKNGR